MKIKTYQSPLCEVVEVEVESGILAGSVVSPGEGSTMGDSFDALLNNINSLNN